MTHEHGLMGCQKTLQCRELLIENLNAYVCVDIKYVVKIRGKGAVTISLKLCHHAIRTLVNGPEIFGPWLLDIGYYPWS